jgi:hypothetical protein
MKYKIIGIHKPKEGIRITELYDIDNESYRRFIAIIDGWEGWKMFEGIIETNTLTNVINKTIEIQEKIRSGKDEVFRYGFNYYVG